MMQKLHRFTAAALGGAVLLAGLAVPLAAQDAPEPRTGTFVPIGGGYTTLHDFVEAALPYWQTLDSDRFFMLMLPMSFTYDPFTLTTTDLLDNSFFIDRRRWQLEEACRDVLADNAVEDVSCRVIVPPVYTREAALDELALDSFDEDLAAVYFPGGDQVYAMQILADTPLEAALEEAFSRGVVMGGNSAGAAMLARNMYAGYNEDFDETNALSQGAVAYWNDTTPGERGLPFGITSAEIEQHVWQYQRLPRVMNYLANPDGLGLVIGVDGFTGGIIRDEVTFGEVFGDYSNPVFDALTYGARDAASFDAETGLLSMQNVLVHVLAPGDYAYDIAAREPSWAPVPDSIERDYSALATEYSGRLQLNGGDAPTLSQNVADASIVTIITGYAPSELDAVAAAYEGPGFVIALGDDDDLAALLADADIDPATVAFWDVIGGDQAQIVPEQLALVGEALQNGANVSLVGAAAAIAGDTYAANPPIDYDNDDSATIEAHDSGSYIIGGTTIRNGLGWVNANVEPALIANNRFGRLFSLAYNHPDTLALGLPDDAAVEFSDGAAIVTGSNSVFVLDLSAAVLGVGENDAFVIANGLIDVWASGQVIGE
ncbi:MAG: Type 1 glutamine amidotransferase-like domain-containing protein [Pleurocapsa minor GSE-CHR-MK-17-07R]|nr:Type 1 glutamine amidotransferase-like domain-containing protein [Pleurocapsa minor GSE-CHR-MK 17-07R]